VALLTPVIVRGINNLSDARYCAGMGAEYLTFRLDPALPDAVTPELVQELSGWVAGVHLIGEFDTMPPEQINAIARTCGLHSLLLHRVRRPDEMSELSLPALTLVQWVPDMLPEDVDNRFRTLARHVAGFVLSMPPPHPLTEFQMAHLTEQARTYSIWLSPGFAPSSLRGMLHAVAPTGLVLEGGNEIRTGVRDFTELEAVFEELEAEE
jgi:phosphoribosylanthranilate isomerase